MAFAGARGGGSRPRYAPLYPPTNASNGGRILKVMMMGVLAALTVVAVIALVVSSSSSSSSSAAVVQQLSVKSASADVPSLSVVSATRTAKSDKSIHYVATDEKGTGADSSVYTSSFGLLDIDGKKTSMDVYRGTVSLVVNVASY